LLLLQQKEAGMTGRMTGVKAGLAVGLVSMLAMAAHAAEIQKADNTDALALGSSWVGGVAPGADDTALFDGEATPTATNWIYGLGGDVVWGGIRATNHVGDLIVTNDGSRLSLGAGGMDPAVKGVNWDNQVSFDVPITLTAPQTWLAPGGGSYFWRPVDGTGSLTLQSGWFAFYDALTMSGGMNVAAGVHVRSNAVVSGAVLVSNGGMLLVNKPVATEWRQSFASGSVTNDGTFVFGRTSGSPAVEQSTVSLKTGDRLIRAVATGDRNRGRVNIFDNDVRMEGGRDRGELVVPLFGIVHADTGFRLFGLRDVRGLWQRRAGGCAHCHGGGRHVGRAPFSYWHCEFRGPARGVGNPRRRGAGRTWRLSCVHRYRPGRCKNRW